MKKEKTIEYEIHLIIENQFPQYYMWGRIRQFLFRLSLRLQLYLKSKQ